MSIQWNKLKNIIKLYLEKGENDFNRNSYKLSEFIQKQYLSEILKNATDPYGNKILKMGSNTGLKDSLLKSFTDCFNSNSVFPLNIRGISGVKINWILTQMSITFIVPPMTVGITNIVDVFGQTPTMNIKNSNNSEHFSNELIKALMKHSQTIGGTYNGLNTVPVPSVPVIIKWVGIQ